MPRQDPGHLTKLAYGALLRCPRCGKRTLFRNWFRVNRVCCNCRLPLDRGDGFYLGAITLNYGLVVFGVLPFVLAAFFLDWVSLAGAGVLGFLAAIVLPVLFYPLSWSLWIAIHATMDREAFLEFDEDTEPDPG